MNHHDPENHPQPAKPEAWIEPELEARVVAWVAGEASTFEAAELERLCAEKPELAIFKRRIEAVHGLVGEAMRPDPTPLVMSAERRAKLLGTLRAADEPLAAAPGIAPAVIEPLTRDRRKQRWNRRWMLAAAACVPLGGVILVFNRYREAESVYEARLTTARKVEGTRPPSTTAPQSGDEMIQLSPFEVREESKLKRVVSDAKRMQAREAVEKPALSPAPTPAAEQTASVALTYAGPPRGAPDAPRAVLPSSTVGGYLTPGQEATLEGNKITTTVTAGGSLTLGATPPSAAERFDREPIKLDAFAVSEQTLAAGYAAASATSDTRQSSTAGSVVFGIDATAAAAPAAPAAHSFADAPKEQARTDDRIELQAFTVSSDASARAAPIGRAGIRPNVGSIAAGGAAGKAVAEKKSTEIAALGAVSGAVAFRAEEGKNEAAQAKDPDAPLARPKQPQPTPSIEETDTAKDAVSTFSLHVGDASFRLAQSALARGQLPDATRIRPEEFYNAFDYGDPAPGTDEKISCRIDQAAHPFLQQRNFVRIAMKVGSSGRGAGTPLRLTVLLDTSGSMEREDRAAAVRRALQSLVSLLGPNDRITLIGFARQPRLLAENLPGTSAAQLLDLLTRTPAEGGTNLEEALKLGGELARRHRLAGAQNRIVLLTDGAANLGNADPAQLAAAIDAFRRQGIAFDACGVGTEGIDDEILERLTRNGDGRYYILNTPEAAESGFARQLAGAFRPAAENVKVQVRFNPARVARHRLIGFEQHRLSEQDFRNDQVDAAELAAEEAAVALYQIEPLPQGDGELGEVFVRFRDPATGGMVERRWTLRYDAAAPAFDRAAPRIQLAGTAALLAEKLRESPLAAQFALRDLAPVVNSLRGHYASQPRVQEFATMFAQLRRLRGE